MYCYTKKLPTCKYYLLFKHKDKTILFFNYFSFLTEIYESIEHISLISSSKFKEEEFPQWINLLYDLFINKAYLVHATLQCKLSLKCSRARQAGEYFNFNRVVERIMPASQWLLAVHNWIVDRITYCSLLNQVVWVLESILGTIVGSRIIQLDVRLSADLNYNSWIFKCRPITSTHIQR